jgi:membrane-bound lytic murein transglycosylase F
LNGWIEDKKNAGLFARLYKKYFVDMRGYIERATSDYLTSSTGKLCPYDDLLKRTRRRSAGTGGCSRRRCIRSRASSRTRSRGRARRGCSNSCRGRRGRSACATRSTRRTTSAARPEYLKWLTDFWDERIEDEGERLKFILASYNTGAGHVEDAQRLASKYGGDPLRGTDVSYWLLQKSTQQYSADEVVKFGFCRGLEPVNYVEQILRRYDHYKEFVVARRTGRKSRRG